MAQIHDGHLTTEQLSASFDKQLSPQEQAIFDAHISTCQQCQNKLSDLRLTTALLHALPEEAVPRSFVLPSSISIVPDRTIRQDTTFTPVPQRQRTQISMLRRSIRVVSTLAAVFALFFIISGMLPLIYPGGGSSTSTTSSNSSSGEASTVHPATSTPGVQQPNRVLPPVGSAATTPPTETAHSLTPTGTTTTKSSSDHSANHGQSLTVPPAIDLSQPVVRLGIGVLVLAVSIFGLIATRRRRVAVD
ncbi:MAG TPA: zf-HC2 domain-containing protein [Ktedonobacteraceae bacterium]|nr:zf-HC2 domain-containing protein [Ktedonobacteraceae bacterium]